MALERSVLEVCREIDHTIRNLPDGAVLIYHGRGIDNVCITVDGLRKLLAAAYDSPADAAEHAFAAGAAAAIACNFRALGQSAQLPSFEAWKHLIEKGD